MFERDEFKRLQTRQTRGLDFADATELFDGRPVITTLAKTEFEVRFVTTGTLEQDKFFTVVWTLRGEATRIISYRRARDDEKRAYHARHG